jgi:hypothetical protein
MLTSRANQPRRLGTQQKEVPLRLCLKIEAEPERRTGSWGQPGRMNPKRATAVYRVVWR